MRTAPLLAALTIACGDAPTSDTLESTAEISTACPSDVLCRGSMLYTSEIGLWYTLWWMPGGGGHWGDWSRYRPELGYYQSGGSSTFGAEVAQFEAMKVDYLLLDHTNGWYNDGGNIQSNGRAVARSLDRRRTVKQAVAAGGCFWIPGIVDRIGCMRSEADLIWRHHANPASHRSSYRFRGKPLMVNYTGAGLNEDWTEPRFHVGAGTGRSAEASSVMLERGLFGWVFDDPTPVHADVMGVTPGWNTAHLGRGTTPLLREFNGGRFQRQWLRAIEHNPKTIIISSWNDFGEETAIQPARRTDPQAELWSDSYGNECPNYYYEIARTYSLLRWGLAHGAYVKDVNRSEVFVVTPGGLEYVNAMPVCAPVVNLPAGEIDRYGNSSCAPTRGQPCTIDRPTDFGSFCWPAYGFSGEAIAYEGCSCRSGPCDPGYGLCECAGPRGVVNCDGACARAARRIEYDFCWPAYSFNGGDMGVADCQCWTDPACPAGTGRCACDDMPGVPVCSGDC